MVEDTKHEWRELPASPIVSTASAKPALDHVAHGRIDQLEGTVEGMAITLDKLAQAPLPMVAPPTTDFEKKIADVHETMTAVLKKSLTDQRCTQQTAHDNLKAAFSELAKRLEKQKIDHGDLEHDVAVHSDAINVIHECLDTLSTDLAKAEIKLDKRVETVVQKVCNWPGYIALLISLLTTALHFVHLK